MTIAKQIDKLREQKRELDYKIDELATSVMPEFSFEHKIGTWECEDSPLGLCVYNHFEDRCWDNCLFCHQPDERK